MLPPQILPCGFAHISTVKLIEFYGFRYSDELVLHVIRFCNLTFTTKKLIDILINE